jgi:hypothetical protein
MARVSCQSAEQSAIGFNGRRRDGISIHVTPALDRLWASPGGGSVVRPEMRVHVNSWLGSRVTEIKVFSVDPPTSTRVIMWSMRITVSPNSGKEIVQHRVR